MLVNIHTYKAPKSNPKQYDRSYTIPTLHTYYHPRQHCQKGSIQFRHHNLSIHTHTHTHTHTNCRMSVTRIIQNAHFSSNIRVIHNFTINEQANTLYDKRTTHKTSMSNNSHTPDEQRSTFYTSHFSLFLFVLERKNFYTI